MRVPSTGIVFGIGFHLWSPLRNHPSYANAATPDVKLLAGAPPHLDGVGTNVMLNYPYSVKISSDGTFALILDFKNFVIRHMVISTSVITTLAGIPGITGNLDGIGTNALFTNPSAISISVDGSYALVGDRYRIRRVEISTASVTTFVGGSSGSSNGIGTSASLNAPSGIDISFDDSFALVCDSNNQLIRRIVLSTASVTTFAGLLSATGNTNGKGTNARFYSPYGITLSRDRSFALVTESMNCLIRKIIISTAMVTMLAGGGSGYDGIGTFAMFTSPFEISLSSDGTFAVIGDFLDSVIRHIVISTATVTTLVGDLSSGFVNGIGTNAKFFGLQGLGLSPNDQLILVADSSNYMIRQVVVSTKAVSTLIGSGPSVGLVDGVGTTSRFRLIRGVAISSDGIFALICEGNNVIRHLTISTNTVTTLAGVTTSGSTNGMGTVARFYVPYAISISSDGVFALIADSYNHLIRHIIISTASVTTLAGAAGTSGTTNGVGTVSRFNTPRSVAISPNGLFALVGDSSNHLIRHIVMSTISVTTLLGAGSSGSTNGVGTTANFNFPSAISISPDNLFALVADTNNQLIRQIIISQASVTTLAGGAGVAGSTNGIGTIARFNSPSDVSISPDGLFALVTEFENHDVRVVDISTGAVTTYAGVAGSLGSTNGMGTNSKFNNPSSVDIAPDSTFVLVTEYSNNAIRKLTAEQLSGSPSLVPTFIPSQLPTISPSHLPSIPQSVAPSAPTLQPNFPPTLPPSPLPSQPPSSCPSLQPTRVPSLQPMASSSLQPSVPPPSAHPSPQLSASPSLLFSEFPSLQPTQVVHQTTSGKDDDNSQEMTAIIIGVVVGGSALLICICIFIYFLFMKSNRKKKISPYQGEEQP
jgi:hypothetical protein